VSTEKKKVPREVGGKWDHILVKRRKRYDRIDGLYKDIDYGWRYFWSKRGGVPVLFSHIKQ